MCYEYWFDEPFELVFSKNHPLAQSETINLNDLQQQHFYLLEPPGDTFDFKKNQIDPKQMDLSYVKDRESIMNFIATSDSVAICPQSYMKKVNSDIYPHIQLPNASRTIVSMPKSNIILIIFLISFKFLNKICCKRFNYRV
ncbi:LysR family transcriptional regulator substrate-binding protein [Staphylococcus saprophyticus]|uniref:LysR family transcriptional regulator substrate-binding protein n=1 Tax=Staphylococcus saprophyticus TaxID=29385 RepID=UPI0009D71079|nr:hypothetical protein EUA49_07955 [Staphylococcus saprophyticus]RXS08377.1 hypothetical protein EUA50_09405 [Staphylococcus saprophyticus]